MQQFALGASRSLQPARQRRRAALPVVASTWRPAPGWGPQQEPPAAASLVLLAAKTAVLATAVSALAAQPAFARGWQERRHHRRLLDEYVAPQDEVRLPCF